jgi:glycosyltransferase involved in cell wall biosynthesis
MRILFLEQFSEAGGGQRNLLDLLPAVTERGWKATVAAPGSGALFKEARAIGADTESIPLGTYSIGEKKPSDAVQLGLDTFRMSRWIRRFGADLISVGGATLLPAVAFGARRRRVIFQAQHFFKDARALSVARWAIRKARAQVIANSKYVASQFESARVVYNGVPSLPFVEKTFEKPWRIGLIGRIAPMKGQTDFLRAAALIPDARFVICGSPMFCPESYSKEVYRLAAGLPVEFVGWQEDVGAVLRGLDLLAVPSSPEEATTRVILEAFSAGVPVVAYAVGGIPEIVRDGENGFLVPERTPEALARKIVGASNLATCAQRAREEFLRRYTVERYRDEMTEAIAIGETPP